VADDCNVLRVELLVASLNLTAPSGLPQSVPPAVIGDQRLGDIPATWIEAALRADALECFDGQWEVGFL
jgi:hypothetical protein